MAISGILLNAGAGALMAGNLFPPLQEFLSQETFDKIPNRIPTIGALINLLYQQHLDIDAFIASARRNGYDMASAKLLYEEQRAYMAEGDIIAAYRRGIIDARTAESYLRARHYSDEDVQTMLQVSLYFPPVPDLIRFGVREVYTPEIARAFGQFDDLPEQYMAEAAKIGLPPEQAKNYWAAHWELPSVMQGMEMLHRGVIDTSTLNLLLRAQDVMPYWRDKLVDIAYNPLTRVDVRRMYSLGVLTRDEVNKSYHDLGYDDLNAERMTEFTVRHEAGEDLGLTRANIIDAYKRDIVSRAEASAYLTDIGYSPTAVEFLLTLADYDKSREYIDLATDSVISSYRAGNISLDELRTVLNQLDLSSAHVNSIINKEMARAAATQKSPSKGDVDRWLKLGLIDEGQYNNYMLRQHYLPSDIRLYLAESVLERDTSTRVHLSVSVYARWMAAGIMSETDFRATLTELKTRESDINRYIREAAEKSKPQETK